MKLVKKAIQQKYEPAIIIMDTIKRIVPACSSPPCSPPPQLEETINFVNDSQLLPSLAKHRITIYESEESQTVFNKQRRKKRTYKDSAYTPDLNPYHKIFIDALFTECYTRKIKLKLDREEQKASKSDIEGCYYLQLGLLKIKNLGMGRNNQLFNKYKKVPRR